MIVNFYSEICCEYCGETVHNHFDCPSCKKEYAGTSIYMDIDLDHEKSFYCEECLSQFDFIKRADDFSYSFEIKQKEAKC